MAFAKNGSNKLQHKSFDSRFVASLNTFNDFFEEWLHEMGKSNVSFSPLNTKVSKADILNLVANYPEKRSRFNPLEVRGHEYYIKALNIIDEKEGLDSLGDSNKKLLATFSKATKEIIKEKISL
jgi:hypothetical protein